MQLLYIKTYSKFRGLAEGSEFSFHPSPPDLDRLEPNCLVGLNGSGKSNLLELIAEIFSFLDGYVQHEDKNFQPFRTEFGFEIKYSLNISSQLALQTETNQLSELPWDGQYFAQVGIKKEKGELPQITIIANEITLISTEDPAYFALPNHIISYSSGHNELLTNPFIRSGYHYFDELTKKDSKQFNEDLPLSRLFALDYENSKLVTVCNFLFAQQNKIDLVSQAVRVRDLDSFSLIIRYRNYRNKPIKFAQFFDLAISKLKSCATLYEETKGEANFRELKLSFKVDDELRRAFQNKFGSAILLFRDFYFLNLMNIHCHPVDTRKQIKTANSLHENLSYMIPVPPRNRLVFLVEDVKFSKVGEQSPIYYKNLSDGEHQLLHVLGGIMLLNLSGSLLLLDEPETHFNPDWRSRLIHLINEVTEEKVLGDERRKQEIFITSHSPFIVSDSKKHKVLIFENGKAKSPEINTYGTSVSILLEEIFKKEETISKMALADIDKLKELPMDTLDEIQKIKEASRILGESVEKVLLFRELLLKEKRIKEDNA